jgi:hypothetical protein
MQIGTKKDGLHVDLNVKFSEPLPQEFSEEVVKLSRQEISTFRKIFGD